MKKNYRFENNASNFYVQEIKCDTQDENIDMNDMKYKKQYRK